MNSESLMIIELLKKLNQHLDIVEDYIKLSNQEGSETKSISSNELVKEFELLVDNHIIPLVECSKRISQLEVINQINQLVSAINEQKKLIDLASKHIKPTNNKVLLELVKSINDYASNVCEIRDRVDRKSNQFNHLSAISESIGFLSWVVLDKTPRAYVEEMRYSAEFYTNKILIEYKGVQNKDQVDWVNHYLNFLIGLEGYIKKYHITGLCWNSKGSQLISSSSTTIPSNQLNELVKSPSSTTIPSNQLIKSKVSEALFNDINGKGESVTNGLKRVTKEMKTNYSIVNKSKSNDIKPSQVSSQVPPTLNIKPPRISNDYDKWLIEHQVDNKDIIISVKEKRQSIYIYKCSNSIIQINGKVNQIFINDCKKTSVVFESAISSCQLVNCIGLEIQVINFVPSISIDKTSGCQIYLSKSSLNTEIITSKSSEMNILIPNESQDSDIIEIPIPEQFKSFIKNNKLFIEPTSHI